MAGRQRVAPRRNASNELRERRATIRNPSTRRTADLPARWAPATNPFSLQAEMERMFDAFGRDVGTGIVYPSVDVEERAEGIHVTAEVPGLTKDGVVLEVAPSGDALSIRGEKRREEQKSERGFRSIERAYGSFQREIPLPTRVDANRVNASLNDGIRTVDLAKDPSENKLCIPVEQSALLVVARKGRMPGVFDR